MKLFFSQAWFLIEKHLKLNMTEGTKTTLRLSKVAKEFNIGINTIVDFLAKKGHPIDSNPNSKVTPEAYFLLTKEFQSEKSLKEETKKVGLNLAKRETITIEDAREEGVEGNSDDFDDEDRDETPSKEITGKNDKGLLEDAAPAPVVEKIPEVSLPGPKVVGKIDISDSKPKKETLPSETVEKESKEIQAETIVNELVTKQEPVQVQEIVKESPKVDSPQAVQEPASETKQEVPAEQADEKTSSEAAGPKILGKVDLDKLNPQHKEKTQEKAPIADNQAQPRTEKNEQAQPKHKEAPSHDAGKEKHAHKADNKPHHNEKKQEHPAHKENAPVQHQPKKQEVTTPPLQETSTIAPPAKTEPDIFKTQVRKLEGPTILGKIDLPDPRDHSKKPVASSSDPNKAKKKKRKRIKKDKAEGGQNGQGTENKTQGQGQHQGRPNGDKNQQGQQKQQHPQGSGETKEQREERQKKAQQQAAQKNKKWEKKEAAKVELTEEEISKQIKETLARLSGTGKSKTSKHRKHKREILQQHRMEEMEQSQIDQQILKVTEFVSANELATMMNVTVNEIISTCMSLGLFVSINQRLDAETITIVASEFGYEVEFVSIDAQDLIEEEVDEVEDLIDRAPIVTVMGHVDHGKTSLLDRIRHTNVIKGEAGGITQHIGAYQVVLENGKTISFLDTPGHEAFTAMRARGAKITDVAIIVVAADDNVMPQTIEAINHAHAANVPIVIAINKIDKNNANPEKVKEELAKINVLVEDWGGKYQSQEISAKSGINIDKLLEKVLLEAEFLNLKANPRKKATGTIIESSLDKGRGYLATLLVQSGTMKLGDTLVAGTVYGKIKAMFNERNQRIKEAGPSTPVQILGLNGAPTAGDTFNVMTSEQEAKSIAAKRQQLLREQGLRTQKHITLDEIGRRIAIGDFKELNIIVKGDVDGSVEALSDSLLKLSTPEVQVNIIHKAVGSITEGDVLLASASNAIIVGFQVRPSSSARKLAEQEQIDIRIYSIIYNAINEIKSAIEGMLSPEIEEKITANIEIREVFKITKVGSVAGCMVLDGKITRNSHVRVIRDGIVVYTGYLGSLKRFKDDAKEVASGYECGLNIDRFNDIKVGDIIEAFETIEIARKLD